MAAPTAPAGGRGGLGWVILAAALAVPSFLFYNWWSSLKAEHDRGVTGKAQKRNEAVFQTPSPATPRLVNPIAASTAAAAGLPRAAAKAPGGAAVAVSTAAAGAATALQTGAAPAIPSALAPTVGSAGSAGAAGGSVTLSSQTVVLARDPMQSPMDVVRIREAEEAEEERERELAERNKPRPKAKPVKIRQSPIKDHIELQGIVAKPDGNNLAIVNGATVNPGESFSVDNYSGKVKVLSISADIVWFEYQKQKFKMSVNTE